MKQCDKNEQIFRCESTVNFAYTLYDYVLILFW
jgi:hypothetical protein